MTTRQIEKANLAKAQAGSWYFIAGCGGSLDEWIEGYEKALAEKGIGKPVAWYWTTGAEINELKGMIYGARDAFPADLTCLLFPLDGLNVGKLAIFRIEWQDRWFDDVLANMKPGRK